MDNQPHLLAFEKGWGTRAPRSMRYWYFKTKPTIEQAIAILQRDIDARASADWFAPHNSGLVSIRPIEWETELNKPLEPSHYVLPRGTNSMVKTADYFNEQKPTWGNDGWKAWKPVYVDIGDDPGLGIEAARELAAHMMPIHPHWTTLDPHLPDERAMMPDDETYKACRGKWRSPIA